MVILSREAPLRYYIYISDYKLDMLYEQISPTLRRRLSGELKIDLKLAGLTLTGGEQPDATRMTKLRAIEHHIDKHHHVGDISDPGREFFRGTMDMQWGWLTPREKPLPWDDGQRAREKQGWEQLGCGSELNSPVTMFRGVQRRAQGIDFVLLGGSRRHVLASHAENDPAALLPGGTSMDILLMALEGHVSQLEGFRAARNIANSRAEHAIEAGLYMAMKGPRQCLNFLAVPFGQAEIKVRGGTVHGVIGTPIYVAHG